MLLITPTMDSQIRKSDAKKFLHDKASASQHDLNFSDDEDPAGDTPVGEDGTRRRPSSGCKRAGAAPPSCQAERCAAVLVDAKRYHRRHKVCEFHAKAPVVIVAGLRQRFCQQCSRFHEVSEFDEAKRSCRRRLAGHNERRRKVSTSEAPGAEGTSHGSPQGDQMKESKCRAATDERGSSAAYSHFQIR